MVVRKKFVYDMIHIKGVELFWVVRKRGYSWHVTSLLHQIP